MKTLKEILPGYAKNLIIAVATQYLSDLEAFFNIELYGYGIDQQFNKKS